MQNKPKEKIRMCVVCRGQSDKKTLLRIVKNKDGEIFVDKTGKTHFTTDSVREFFLKSMRIKCGNTKEINS